MSLCENTVLRFNAIVRGPSIEKLECSIVYMQKHREIVEYWLKCSNLIEAISSLRVLASQGPLLATGGLNGAIYRFIPSTLNEFLNTLSSRVVLEPKTSIIAEPCTNDITATINTLGQYLSRIRVRGNSNKIWGVLTKPLEVGLLFDSRVRLLKPFVSPPQLYQRYTGPRNRGSSMHRPETDL